MKSKILWKIGKRLCRDRISEREYIKWKDRSALTSKTRNIQKNYPFQYLPLFSIVVPLYQTPISYLEGLITSVKAQTYSNWELCLSEGSGNAGGELRQHLEICESGDRRIRVVFSKGRLNISENTNQALRLARGNYIVFADHDDLLAENALFECARVIERDRSVELLYSDEDKVDGIGKGYFQPHFKPDFDHELLRSMNYFCHLVVVKKELLDAVGGLRREYDGAQDYDFVLRCTDKAQSIYHIPRVLYHWRAHQKSLAGNTGSKNYAVEAGKNALKDHLRRRGVAGEVESTEVFGVYHINYCLAEGIRYSVIISMREQREDFHEYIQRILYSNSKWIDKIYIVGCDKNQTTESNVEWIYCDHHRTALEHYNIGMRYVESRYCLLMESNVDIATEYINAFVAFCAQAQAAVAGGILKNKKNRIIQGNFFVNRMGTIRYPFKMYPAYDPGYFARLRCTQECFGVATECFVTDTLAFKKVRGFKEGVDRQYAEADFFCKLLKVNEKTVFDPKAEIYKMESHGKKEINLGKGFVEQWKEMISKQQKFYNLNLDEKGKMYTLCKR